MSRIHDSLPNGYCGRPPQQDCPHPNACLTCPDSRPPPSSSTSTGGSGHGQRRLIAHAEADGQFRLADNLRRVRDSLDQIIPALRTSAPPRSPAMTKTDNTRFLTRANEERRQATRAGPGPLSSNSTATAGPSPSASVQGRIARRC